MKIETIKKVLHQIDQDHAIPTNKRLVLRRFYYTGETHDRPRND